MRLFLIRHAETEHNIAGLLAGSTDSRLTTHGITQTQLLATHLVKTRGLQFTHIVSSDQERAQVTAGAIVKEAEKKVKAKQEATAEVRDGPEDRRESEIESGSREQARLEDSAGLLTQIDIDSGAEHITKRSKPMHPAKSPSLRVWTDALIREKHFGERELQSWSGGGGKNKNVFESPRKATKAQPQTQDGKDDELAAIIIPEESDEAIRQRATRFVRETLLPLVIASAPAPAPAHASHTQSTRLDGSEDRTVTVALVSHGITLRYIYAAILAECGGGAKGLIISPTLNAQLSSAGGKSGGKGGGKGGSGGEWAETQHARIKGGWVPGWSNTGFVELNISQCSASSSSACLVRKTEIQEGESVSNRQEDGKGKIRAEAQSTNEINPLAETPLTGLGLGLGLPATSPAKSPSLAPPPPSPPAITTPPIPPKLVLTLHAINSTPHLSTLKRTRGGVGSAVWDGKQRTLDSLFLGGAGKRIKKAGI